jgi:uncharacterized protein YdcH (DUF465 family)
MKIENEKLKADYNTRISSLSGKLESVEFDNANLFEKNAALCTGIKEMEGEIESLEQMYIDSIRKGNFPDFYLQSFIDIFSFLHYRYFRVHS